MPPTPPPPTRDPGPDAGRTTRSAAKRRAIMRAATTCFLTDGYRATTMDRVASEAGVAKQTVYQHFHDKEGLFREIVLDVSAHAEAIVTDLVTAIGPATRVTSGSLEPTLTGLARRYLAGVLQPSVVALRRLVVAEVERFPDLAATYFARAPGRAIDVLAGLFSALEGQDLLVFDDAVSAGTHFAYLVLGAPLDRAQFFPHEPLADAERDRLADAAVRTFLAAYSPG